MEIIDISMTLEKGMVTYPNNTKFNIKNLGNTSEIKIGTHAGTHIDAPKHAGLKKGVDEVKLKDCIGNAKVIHIKVREIRGKELKKFEISRGDIVLIKTTNRIDKKFNSNFAFLDESAARYLIKKGIKAVGIDSLSIKQRAVKNKVHNIFLSKNIPIYEGLMLSKVNPGNYYFIGFPLKIKNADGSPLRAVLIK